MLLNEYFILYNLFRFIRSRVLDHILRRQYFILYNLFRFIRSRVLDHIWEKAKVGEERKWTKVKCDSLPYTPESRIIGSSHIKIHYYWCKHINQTESKLTS